MESTPATRPRGRLGPFGLVQVVAVEVALAALLFVPHIRLEWRGGIAAAIVIVGLGFIRGRSWFGWAGQWLRWRSRVRLDRRETAQPGPSLSVDSIDERGIDVGVAFDGTGWFSAVRLESDAAPGELFASLTRILDAAHLPVSSVQLVTRSVSGARENWFAVRLDVRGSHAVALERGGGAIGVHRALSAAVRRLLKGSDDAGVHLRALTAQELTHTVKFSVDGGAVDGDRPQERWKHWHSGNAAHVTYWLRGKTADGSVPEELWTKLTELDADSRVVSLALRKASTRPGEERLMLRCLVRLAGEPGELGPLGRELAGLARDHRMKLVRCHGIQGPATYASAVSGGVW